MQFSHQQATVAELADRLREPDGLPLLVVSGAGVSLASGIPTFRGTDAGAVWANDVVERGTYAYFRTDPVGSWQWYGGRFDALADAKPNPAHESLVTLERSCQARGSSAGREPFLLVTQNVDGLHRAAGSTALVEVHGRADRVRCARDGCPLGSPSGSIERAWVDFAAFWATPSPDTLPRCPRCSDLVRPHVLWFDESYDEHRDYQIDRCLKFAKHAATIVFVGTSFSVGITDALLRRGAQRGASMFSIDPGGGVPHPRLRVVSRNAEDALPELVQAVG